MKTKDDLTEAELACLELYEMVENGHESRADVYQGRDYYPKAYNIGKAITESLKPKLKPVDMSVLIDSGVYCRFSNHEGSLDEKGFNSLLKICNPSTSYLYQSNQSTYRFCKPRTDYWFSAVNFTDVEKLIDRLHDAGFKVTVNRIMVSYGESFIGGGVSPGGINAFKIEPELRDGFCWPWEVE